MTENKKKKKLNVFRLFILISIIVILITIGTSVGLVAASVMDMPDINVGTFKYNAATLIYDQDDNLVTKIGMENRIPVKINEIPKTVQNAFLAVEDVRFYQHHGVDLRGIARAMWQNITNGQIKEGASTITQQLVRDLYLSKDQKFKRKIQEMFLAVKLERKLSKDEILELYLNRIYFGEGAYGINTAAETYFGKKLNDLGLKEAALLAGLPQAPSAYSPYQNRSLALKRRNIVLENMLKYKFINEYDYNNTVNDNLGTLETPATKEYPYPYYIDYITEQLIAKYGESQVFTGGLTVHIAMDRKMQTIAQEVLANNANFPTKDIQAATVVIDPQTGYIKALVGGRGHTNMRQWNRATQTYRQPGSAFKPIVAYGPAIELGKSPASVVDDSPVTYNGWSPHNSNGKYNGLTTLRTALTHSINIVAVKLLKEVTIPEATKFAKKLGITSLDPNNDVGLSMALGGLYKGVTPLELAGAYSAFNNLGVYIKPTAIIRVKKADGTVLDETPHPTQYVAMKPTTAYLVTDMLQSVIQKGTGKDARLNRPVAGKTGTTESGKDIWFAGYTPELVSVVWLGYDDPKPTPYFGGEYPARIWRNIMGKILENEPVKKFPPRPKDIVSATVDTKSGLLPGPNTPENQKVTDLFAAGTVPNKIDDSRVLIEVCAVSGKLPNDHCPDRITKVFLKTPSPVSSSVADNEQRIPTEVCTVHESGTSPIEVIPHTDIKKED